jgi:hypothetical protein
MGERGTNSFGGRVGLNAFDAIGGDARVGIDGMWEELHGFGIQAATGDADNAKWDGNDGSGGQETP